MAQLSASEIYEIARGAGFNPDQAVTMTAIALAESGGRTDAHNPNGEDSRGLWQINWEVHAGASWARGLDAADLNDPRVNAIAAYHVSGGGADIRPWTVTHRDNIGHYPHYADPRYRDPAIQAAIDHGDLTADGNFRGPANYRSPPVPAGDGPGAGAATMPSLGDPHDTDTPALAGAGTSAVAANQIVVEGFDDHAAEDAWRLDSDHDGLSDGAEWLVRTDAHATDSDQDGLGDREEIRLGLNPRAPDSDLDGRPDAMEVHDGTDPLRAGPTLVDRPVFHDSRAIGVDTDGDGIDDALERLDFGTNPLDADSDHDGSSDLHEINLGWDPLHHGHGESQHHYDAVLAEDHHLEPPHHP